MGLLPHKGNNMKNPIRSILFMLVAIFATFAVAQAFEINHVIAQVDTPPPSNTELGVIDTVLSFAAALATKYGFIGKIFAVLTTISGFCALTVKPIWDKFVYPGITSYVQSTATKKDDEFLANLLSNKVVKVLLWALNLLAHIKVPIIDKDGAAVSPSSAGTTLPAS